MTDRNQNMLDELKEEATVTLAKCETVASLEEWRVTLFRQARFHFFCDARVRELRRGFKTNNGQGLE